METAMFHEKMQLLLDPYFDREYFTNLIYCMDRKKSPREMFEAAMNELALTAEFNDSLDRAILHLFYSYQSSQLVRDTYQWLPLAQGFYATALYRGNGQKQVKRMDSYAQKPLATTADEFENAIRTEIRGVESLTRTWGGWLFLLENRSSRTKAVAAVIREAIKACDALSFSLLIKGLDLAVASGWRANAPILMRSFERFWTTKASDSPKAVNLGFRLARIGKLEQDAAAAHGHWEESWGDEAWDRMASESAESVWSLYEGHRAKGCSLDQLFTLHGLFLGRCFNSMAVDQWPRVSAALMFCDALRAAARWVPEWKTTFLAIQVFEIMEVAQLVGRQRPEVPTGKSVLDGAAKNISKDRLVLRLDDAVERGDRAHGLELLAVILKDLGLTHSISDRLILMAAKQDAWTFDMRTLPIAQILTSTHDAALRASMSGPILLDAMCGLLRFLCDQREYSLSVVKKTGTYGDGLQLSQYDVSSGARIVDRFVFNQMRNAQRVKVWPSNN